MNPILEKTLLAAAVCSLALCIQSCAVHGRSESPSTVATAIVRTTTVVDDLSSRFGSEARYEQFGKAARLTTLLDGLRASAQGALDKTPDRLNAAQQRMLSAIRNATAELQHSPDLPPTDAPQGKPAERSPDALPRLPDDPAFAIRQPAILDSSPSVLAPAGLQEIPFTFRGVNLANAAPRLFFHGTEARRKDLKPQQVTFTVPSALLRGRDSLPTVYSGELLLAQRHCTWGMFCKRTTREYTVPVLVLANRLATAQISFTRRRNAKVYEKETDADEAASPAHPDKLYIRRFDYSTDEMTLMSCMRETQTPHAPGYFIDPDTLSTSVTDSSGQNSWKLVDVSPESFTVELCAQSQMSKLRKLTGSISVQATWKEYRMTDIVTPQESLPLKTLEWGTAIEEMLPPDSNSVSVALAYFDGSRSTLSGDRGDKYVETKWDPAAHQLVIAPRDPVGIEGLD